LSIIFAVALWGDSDNARDDSCARLGVAHRRMHVARWLGVLCELVRAVGRGNPRKPIPIPRMALGTCNWASGGRGSAGMGGGRTVASAITAPALGLTLVST